MQHPELLPLLTPLSKQEKIPGALNNAGQSIIDAFRTDTRNLYVGAATLPSLFLWEEKIVAYNKITKYAEQLAQSQHATGMQDVILSTDQAYWQVISLVNKEIGRKFPETCSKVRL